MEPSVLKDHHGPKVVVEGGKTTMLLPLRANARFSQTASVRGSRHGRPSPLIAR